MSTITKISGVWLIWSQGQMTLRHTLLNFARKYKTHAPPQTLVLFYCTNVCNQQQKQIRMPKPDDNDSGAPGNLSTSLLYLHLL